MFNFFDQNMRFISISKTKSQQIEYIKIEILSLSDFFPSTIANTSKEAKSKSKSPTLVASTDRPAPITINSKFIRHLIGEKLQKESLNSKLSKLKKAKPEKLTLSQKISGEVTTSDNLNKSESNQVGVESFGHWVLVQTQTQKSNLKM